MKEQPDIREFLGRQPVQPRIAVFEHVSEERFRKDIAAAAAGGEMDCIEDLSVAFAKLPCRATAGSAGYDFFSPFGFVLAPGHSVTIPTGVRCIMDPNWVLTISPKSGKGSRFRVMMRNTIAWIDSDYQFSDNEGHIIIKIINDNYEDLSLVISPGDAVMQGVFLPYGITLDDHTDGIRNGGFGSTVR